MTPQFDRPQLILIKAMAEYYMETVSAWNEPVARFAQDLAVEFRDIAATAEAQIEVMDKEE